MDDLIPFYGRPHRPNLLRSEVADLATHTTLGGDTPDWGTPLLDVIHDIGPWMDWLEAAVLAGYVPHIEGIRMAMRGYHLWAMGDLEEYVKNGDDTLGYCTLSDTYREISQLLEQGIIDVETTAEAAYSRLAAEQEDDGKEHFARALRRGEAAARRRAQEARQRLAQLNSTRWANEYLRGNAAAGPP
jgi:hypothetical protein